MIKIENGKMSGITNKNGHVLIAGPCGYESPQMFEKTAEHIARHSEEVRVIRGPFTKPRTSAGWYGVGSEALPHALETAQKLNLIYGTEIETRDDVLAISHALCEVGGTQKVLVWNGARNTSSGVLKNNARAIMGELPDDTILMLKNPAGWDTDAWRGLIDHLDAANFPRDRILWAHRGASIKGMPNHVNEALNPRGFRNIPRDEIALQIAKETGIPIIRDDSHIYGPPSERIVDLAEKYMTLPYHGHILEVNSNPVSERKSDAGQQLSLEQFEKWMEIYAQFANYEGPPNPDWKSYTTSW